MDHFQRFIVEICTADKITSDADIDEMAQNIADGIVKEAQEYGITPESSDTYIKCVYVKGWYSDKQIIENVL